MNQDRVDIINEKQIYEKIIDIFVIFIYLFIALLITFPIITWCDYDFADVRTRCPEWYLGATIPTTLVMSSPFLIPLLLLLFCRKWLQIKEKRYEKLWFSNMILSYPLDIFIYFIPKTLIISLFLVLSFASVYFLLVLDLL